MLFSEILKTLILYNRLTQKRVSELTKIPEYRISKYCCDIQEPSKNDIIDLAKFFDVSTDQLLGKTHLTSFSLSLQRVVCTAGLKWYPHPALIYCVKGCEVSSSKWSQLWLSLLLLIMVTFPMPAKCFKYPFNRLLG